MYSCYICLTLWLGRSHDTLHVIVILHNPSVFYTGQIRELERDVVETITQYIFQALDGVTNFCSTSRYMWLWFLILYDSLFSSGRGNSKGFSSAFPTVTGLRKTVWEFYRFLSISIPIIHSRAGKIATGWVLGLTGSIYESDFSQNSIDHLTSINPYFI